jgi:predicted metal-binding membrane protein
MLVLAIGAWIGLVMVAHGDASVAGPDAHAVGHQITESHLPGAFPGGLSAVGHWLLMSAAMMLPSTVPAVRHTAFNSLRHRRHRAVAVFAAAYLAVWLAFGAVGGPLVSWLGRPSANVLAAALGIAATWQLTRYKRRFLRACGVTVPLPPRGLKADAACARYGLRYGAACVGSCWALMGVMLVATRYALPLMALLSGIVWMERLLSRGTRFGPRTAAALGMAGLATVVL